MSNVFEQPWLLLGVAIFVLLGVLTFRSVWPEKQRVWQWLLPLGVVGLAFGLDALVTTDLEKIQGVMNTAIRAIEKENSAAVAACIASNYHDSRHGSKADVTRACRNYLQGPTVKKIRKISSNVEISKTQAVVTLFLALSLEEKSRLVQLYGVVKCTLGMQVYLAKQPDTQWLITSAELRAVNSMPMNWGGVQEP